MDLNDETTGGNRSTSTNGESAPQTIPGRNGGTLQPWRPGQSGNPKGMEKGTLQFKTIMRLLLEEQTDVTINGQAFKMTRAEFLMLEKFRLATTSPFDSIRLRAIMDIEDRMEGRARQSDDGFTPVEDENVIFYIPNKNSRIRPSE